MTRVAHIRRSLLALTIVAVTAVAALAVPSAPASADPVRQPPPAPKAPPTTDDLFARLIAAEQSVTDASIRLLLASESSLATERAAARARMRATAAATAFAAADRALEVEKGRLRRLAVGAYVSGQGTSDVQVGEVLRGRISDQNGRAVILFGEAVKRLLERVRAARRVRASDQQQAQLLAAEALQVERVASDRGDRRAAALQHQRDALAHRQDLRNALRVAAFSPQPQVPLTVPLLGDPRLTPQDLAAWFAQSNYHARTTVPVEFLAAWFIDEGRQEGVRGDIAFAQAVLETGGFTNLDSVFANNYAGIGHCDTCPGGFVFPTPQLGVRAQIQLLKSYAVKQPLYVNALVDRRLRGPAGCCPTWGDLTQKWATAPTYGPRIMQIYTDIMDFALRRHAALLPSG